jgi:hypothetical protein
MLRQFRATARDLFEYYWPFLIAYVLVKLVQVVLYPDPYMISDTGEYLNSARTLETNPYKPIGYSLFLAFSRIILPFPLGVTILHSLLKLIATLCLGTALSRFYSFSRRVVLLACVAIALNPTALLFDHYLLSDSLFVSLSVGIIAALLVYAKRQTWPYLITSVLLALAAVSLRFVGLVYPVLVCVAVLLYGGKWRALYALSMPVTTAALLLALATKTHNDLGVFKITTFDGWAFHGTIGHLMESDWDDLKAIEDPEAKLVYSYLLSFPLEKFHGRHRDFFRWHPESPAKNLLNVFQPITERPNDTQAKRDSSFIIVFMALAESPNTPAQELFEKYRNKKYSKLPPYVMDYRYAFIVTNELLRKANKEFMKQHWRRYLTDFYATSLRKLFLPLEPPIVRGGYPYRESSDQSVVLFWPGELSSDWRPRFGDAFGAVNWTHQWFVTCMWVVALHAFLFAFTRRKALAIPWPRFLTGVGVLFAAFAVAFGALVAYSHMMEVRYTTPIMPFAIVATAFLYLAPKAPWDGEQS